MEQINLPDVALPPAGLPGYAVCRLRKFAKTRASLYCLSVVWSLFAAVMGFLVWLGVLEPISWSGCLRWLPGFIGFVMPGLPENLVDITVKRPVGALALFGMYVLIRRASTLVKAAEWEYAFQVQQRAPIAGVNVKIPKPSAFVRCIETIAPLCLLTWVVAIVIVCWL